MKRQVAGLAIAAVVTMYGCGSSPGTPGASDARHPVDALSLLDAAPLFDGAPDAIPDAGALVPVAYGLNDVSVLFPLPPNLVNPSLLTLSSQGNGGPLLSKDMFAMLEGVVPPHGQVDFIYPKFYIVGARIDPCFPDLALLSTNPSMCQHQLRLIAQQLNKPADDLPVASDDSAIHLLYDLSAEDFTAMATRFLAVATNETRNASVALGIHPTIVAQGLDGAVATELRATILAYAGSATLSRCTITQGDDNNDIWQFAGFDVSGGVMTPITIADLPNPVTFQEVQDQAFDQVMTLFPDSTQSTAFAPLEGIVDFTVPQGVSLTASPSELAAAMQVTFDLDTPSKFNANSLDCVSCHIAGRVRDHGIALGATDDGQPRFTDPPFNLGLITSERATSFAYRTMQCARLATSAMRRCSTSVWPTRARRWPACWRRYCRRNRHSSLPMG